MLWQDWYWWYSFSSFRVPQIFPESLPPCVPGAWQIWARLKEISISPVQSNTPSPAPGLSLSAPQWCMLDTHWGVLDPLAEVQFLSAIILKGKWNSHLWTKYRHSRRFLELPRAYLVRSMEDKIVSVGNLQDLWDQGINISWGYNISKPLLKFKVGQLAFFSSDENL